MVIQSTRTGKRYAGGDVMGEEMATKLHQGRWMENANHRLLPDFPVVQCFSSTAIASERTRSLFALRTRDLSREQASFCVTEECCVTSRGGVQNVGRGQCLLSRAAKLQALNRLRTNQGQMYANKRRRRMLGGVWSVCMEVSPQLLSKRCRDSRRQSRNYPVRARR